MGADKGEGRKELVMWECENVRMWECGNVGM